MKKTFYPIFILLISSNCLFAQQKIDGFYDAKYRTFRPKDQHILVKDFFDSNLAPFMIMGKNPFAADSNRVGFIDTTGRIVIKPDYNNCSYFRGGYALVLTGGKTYRDYKLGLINKAGKKIIPIEYDRLAKCQNGLFMAMKDGKIGFINLQNKVVVPFGKYTDYATPPPVYTEGDDVGHSEFRWDELYFRDAIFFRNYIGVKSGEKWAVIDSTGQEIVPPKFDGIEIFNNKIAPAKIGSKFGVADISGNMIIPVIYDRIHLTGKSYLYVYNGTKMGLLTLGNRTLIPLQFKSIALFGDGFTAVDSTGKAILFDADGKQLATAHNPEATFPVWGQKDEGFTVYNSGDKQYHTYQEVLDFYYQHRKKHRQIFYKRNGQWGLLDTTGREVTPPLCDSFDRDLLYYTTEGGKYVAVRKNNRWGVVDMDGKVRLKIVYDTLLADNNRLFVKKGGKYGLLNGELEQLIPPKYDSLIITYPAHLYNPNWESAFVRARLNNKWGLLDNRGKELISFKYDELLWVYKDLVLVKNNGKYGVAKLQGEQTADCIYDEIRFNDWNGAVNYDNNLVTKKDGLYGLINSAGLAVTAPVYENIIPLFRTFAGKFQVKYHGKVGVVDGTYGQLIIPCEYDDFKFYNGEGAASYARNWYQKYSTLIIAFKNGYCGLLDSLGKVRLPIVHNKIYWSDDVYYVQMDGKQGVVDKNTKWIIPPKYYWISVEHKGFYTIHTSNSLGLVRLDGLVIAEAVYQQYTFCGDIIILGKDNKYGTIDFEGKVIDPFIYSKIECRGEKLIKLAEEKIE